MVGRVIDKLDRPEVRSCFEGCIEPSLLLDGPVTAGSYH